MQDKDTAISTFFQVFEPILAQDVWSKIHSKIPGLDKSVKKLKTRQLVLVMANGLFQEYGALREISTSLTNDDLSCAVGLDQISSSQISRRLRTLSPSVPGLLLKHLTHKVALKKGFTAVNQTIGNLYLTDASTISLCLSRYPWAEFRKTKGGVKLHLRLKFDGVPVPDKAVITDAKTADKKEMDELIVNDEDAINVFDRGYVDYTKFDAYCDNGIRFVSRLKDNAAIEFIGERPVNEDSPIEEDVDIILGANAKKMRNKLRVVTVYDSEKKPVSIVTNVFDLSAEEIADIYRYRWQIELFFKWLKQHSQVRHFFSLSQDSVTNQLLLALVVYCAIMLIKLDTHFPGDLLTVQRLIRACMFETYSAFVRKLYVKHGKKSRGRQRLNHDQIYQSTEQQIMNGDIEILNDLTYDPVIF